MKIKIILIVILLLVGNRLIGQNRIIYGRVIDEELEPVPRAMIRIDSLTLGETDAEGKFQISIPENKATITLFLLAWKKL